MPLFKLPVSRKFTLADARALGRFALRRLNEERLPQVAGSLTFTTVLALVPVLTIALAIFTNFPIFNTLRASLEAFFIKSVMPKAISDTILGNLNQFASKATRLSLVGAVALILTTIVTMLTIDRAFNQIWRVKETRSFIQRMVMYWAIMTLGPLLLGVSISVTSYLSASAEGWVPRSSLIGQFFYTALSIALTMGTFTLLYAAVPNRVVDWRDAAWGGLFAAIAFEIAKMLFVEFIAKFPTYTIIYGALAALPLFLLWIYMSWFITLMGAVVAAALPVVKYERWWHVPAPGSTFVDAMAILKVLHEARESGKSAAVEVRELRMRTRLGFDELEMLLEKMLEAGWVGRIKANAPRRAQFGKKVDGLDAWALTANPRQLKVADVYRLFVFNPRGNKALARQVEEAVEQGLPQTLAAHFAEGREAAPVRTMPARSASASTSPNHPGTNRTDA